MFRDDASNPVLSNSSADRCALETQHSLWCGKSTYFVDQINAVRKLAELGPAVVYDLFH